EWPRLSSLALPHHYQFDPHPSFLFNPHPSFLETNTTLRRLDASECGSAAWKWLHQLRPNHTMEWIKLPYGISSEEEDEREKHLTLEAIERNHALLGVEFDRTYEPNREVLAAQRQVTAVARSNRVWVAAQMRMPEAGRGFARATRIPEEV